jgi:hypothetical protein
MIFKGGKGLRSYGVTDLGLKLYMYLLRVYNLYSRNSVTL